jgi:hypothetical protein
MESSQRSIDKLIAFRNRNKFSAEAWDSRGLMQSSDELCNELTDLFNNTADELINALNTNSSSKQLFKILKSNLSLFRKQHYDTEEKEFIVDVFFELSEIVEVDIKDHLNKWLYGSLLVSLMKIQKILKPERIIETLLQPCTKCEVELETHILKKIEGIPEGDWLIAKCNNCGEFNLIILGSGISESRFGNYQWVDTLRRDEYNYEHALNRLEQIKFFRK